MGVIGLFCGDWNKCNYMSNLGQQRNQNPARLV
jgi:hypothetical protein